MPASHVRHDADGHRFVLDTPDGPARLDYVRDGSTVTFTHTAVPEAQQGEGRGGQLAEAALDFARENGLTVEPQCPFVAHYMDEHPETQDLRA